MKTKIMTKVLSATLALSMMFGAGAAAIGSTAVNPFAIKASAADTMTVKLDGISYEYEIGDEGLTIKSAQGDFPENYTIPEKLNGINVKCIGWYSFKGQNVKNVTIPKGIVNFGNRAFIDCVSLKTVCFNAVNCSTDNATYAGVYNFFGGSTLSKIVFGEDVVKVPDNLLVNASNLETVIFKDTVTNIGESAFENCTSLKSIETYTENGVEKKNDLSKLISIGKWAFYNTSYQKFIAPDSLRTIGEGAFMKSAIRELSLGKITSLGADAFSECRNLKTVTIPETLTEGSIDIRVFYGCTKLETVYFNANGDVFEVTAVGDGSPNMFGDSGVTKVVFGKNVTSVPSQIFRSTSCSTNLKTVVFEAKIKTVGQDAFRECKDLEVYFPGTENEWKKVEISKGNEALKSAKMHFNEKIDDNKDGRVVSVEINDISLNYKSSSTIKPDVKTDDKVNYTVKYESSNTKVATVDKNGKVTGVGKGSAKITCTVTDEFGNSVFDTCTVTVRYTFWQAIIKYILFGWIWY